MFRPFKLRLAGDIAYHIKHPEQLWLHPYSRSSFSVGLTDGSTHHLNLNLVTALEFLPEDGTAVDGTEQAA